MLPLSTRSKACRTRKVTESTGRSYLKTRNWTPARQACTAEKSQWICLQSVQHAQVAITTYSNDTQEQGQIWRLSQHELQKATRELSATRFDTVQLCVKTASFSLLKSTANQVLLATTSCFSPRMQNCSKGSTSDLHRGLLQVLRPQRPCKIMTFLLER